MGGGVVRVRGSAVRLRGTGFEPSGDVPARSLRSRVTSFPVHIAALRAAHSLTARAATPRVQILVRFAALASLLAPQECVGPDLNNAKTCSLRCARLLSFESDRDASLHSRPFVQKMRGTGFEPSGDVPARSLRSLRGLRLPGFKSGPVQYLRLACVLAAGYAWDRI